MSMDDVMGALRTFEADLGRLDEALHAAAADVNRHHDDLAALWQDDFARRYHQQWQRFAHHLDTYLRREAPRYHAFLQSRIGHLSRYLGDG